jgi:hypothetical protein
VWLINLFPLSVCGLDGSVTLTDLQAILKLPHNMGAGYKDPGLGVVYRGQLKMMSILLNLYIVGLKGNFDINTTPVWTQTSLIAAKAAGKGPWLA